MAEVGAFRSLLIEKETGGSVGRQGMKETEGETGKWGADGFARAGVPPLLIMRLHDRI